MLKYLFSSKWHYRTLRREKVDIHTGEASYSYCPQVFVGLRWRALDSDGSYYKGDYWCEEKYAKRNITRHKSKVEKPVITVVSREFYPVSKKDCM